MDELTNRVVKLEAQIEGQDKRLDRHGQYIREMQMQNVEQDAQLKKLCVNQERAYALAEKAAHKLDEISTQGETVSWMVKLVVFGLPALFTLYLTLKEMGFLK